MTLALIVAFLAHPIAWLLILSALGLIGMAVNASGPMKNFGVFSASGIAQLTALLGTYYTTFAAGVTTGTIPANALTGGFDVFLDSAATTPGAQTTRTAAQLWADAVNQFGPFINDPAISTNGLQYTLTIKQTGAGTFTLAGGTGVTLVGATQTVPVNTTRQWVVNLTPTAATFTSVGTGTFS
jgi:hypothetical protein